MRAAVGFNEMGDVMSTSRSREWKAALMATGPQPCFYCGLRLTNAATATVDHKTPISMGGADHQSNYAIACLKCNRGKADMNEAQFRALREHWARKRQQSTTSN